MKRIENLAPCVWLHYLENVPGKVFTSMHYWKVFLINVKLKQLSLLIKRILTFNLSSKIFCIIRKMHLSNLSV